jgi:hypothetical protein
MIKWVPYEQRYTLSTPMNLNGMQKNYWSLEIELRLVSEHVPVIKMKPRSIEYFQSLIGTRHVDPTSGLQYEVVQVKMNRKRYIIVYRRRVSHGELSGALDGPIHAEEVVRWTEDGLELKLTTAMKRKQLLNYLSYLNKN